MVELEKVTTSNYNLRNVSFFMRFRKLYEWEMSNRYSLLYYQFVKNAFGLCHRDKEDGYNVYLRIYFDEIPAGATERGKRTIAKEKLFYHILGHIRNLKGYENFEIYCDTPAESAVDYWRHPYRHWQFLANEFRNQSGV